MNETHPIGYERVLERTDRATEAEARARPTPTTSTPAKIRGAQEQEWPSLNGAARYGLSGEIVAAIEPHTESDPVAILIQTLTAFGAHVGRGRYFAVEGDRHYGNLFAVLTGASAKARKGTSWGRVKQVFSGLQVWCRTPSGLSSGEGLKWAVRDPVESNDKGGKPVVKDEGVTDKRMLVTEPEFTNVLRQNARQGNTLSATLRQAWDSGTLETLTKTDSVVVTGAHIAVIGHITREELRAELSTTDQANGFANRFLFLCVRRSKLLPHGGQELEESLLEEFRRRLALATSHARAPVPTRMTAGAKDLWEAVYPVLSEGYDGLLGAVTARAEAQVVRLALLYALLDCAPEVDEDHLKAALAVWDYAEQSARYIFGSALGDRVADEILRALRAAGKEGMTRTEISHLFKRHESAERIAGALSVLSERNLAQSRMEPTAGRTTEIWFACAAN